MGHYDPNSLHDILLEVIRFHYCRTHKLLEKIGIYPGQPPMLLELQNKDGQSQSELARKLKIKPATVTVMINRMEKVGLLERRQDPDDKRISRIYLTQKGRNMCRELERVKQKIDSECLINFTVEEQILLRRLLMQVRDNLKMACESDKKLDN